MKREDLPHILHESITELGGAADIVTVCKHVWDNYRVELEKSGDLFYTWQYDIRWAATELRKNGIMRPAESSARGVWELA